MPTVLRIGRYRFFFYSQEGNEPPHIHVESDDETDKFWLPPPFGLAFNAGYSAKEINQLRKLVIQNQEEFLNAWLNHFNK